jgi:uncharacterized membrane protein YcaP (DUF421 family)
MDMLNLDWQTIFKPETPIAEIMLRGTLVYLFLFTVLRVMRRQAGGLNITDLLLIVLVADAAQNAMGADYKSITEGVILVATIATWDYALDWLGFRVPRLRRLIHPESLLLIQHGLMLRNNMRRALLTEEELLGQLREHGVDNPSEVKSCALEGDGQLSVVKKR